GICPFIFISSIIPVGQYQLVLHYVTLLPQHIHQRIVECDGVWQVAGHNVRKHRLSFMESGE
ncbi:hypothetical protein, partial [Enterobacter hormaechei]|uniref:hypothetical protein n=1 Tax=Enterobacter hormaechei TaxID=158836 RepID=UPI003CC684C2